MGLATSRPPRSRVREQILEVASRLMEVQGYHRTAVEDIIQQSGTGKGNFYHHFRSKEALGFAIVDRIGRRFTERTLAPIFDSGRHSPIEQVEAFLGAMLARQRDRNCVGGCPLGNLAAELADVHEGFRQRLAEVFDVWRERLAGAIRRGQAEGTIVAGVDPDHLARFLVAGLEGGVLLSKVQRDIRTLEACVRELGQHLRLYCAPPAGLPSAEGGGHGA